MFIFFNKVKASYNAHKMKRKEITDEVMDILGSRASLRFQANRDRRYCADDGDVNGEITIPRLMKFYSAKYIYIYI